RIETSRTWIGSVDGKVISAGEACLIQHDGAAKSDAGYQGRNRGIPETDMWRLVAAIADHPSTFRHRTSLGWGFLVWRSRLEFRTTRADDQREAVDLRRDAMKDEFESVDEKGLNHQGRLIPPVLNGQTLPRIRGIEIGLRRDVVAIGLGPRRQAFYQIV